MPPGIIRRVRALLAQPFRQRLRRFFSGADEDETLPYASGDAPQAHLFLVAPEKAFLVADAFEIALEIEGPPVEAAREQPGAVPIGAMFGHIAAMGAHVVEAIHVALPISANQQFVAERREIAGEEVASPRDLLDTPDHVP